MQCNNSKISDKLVNGSEPVFMGGFVEKWGYGYLLHRDPTETKPVILYQELHLVKGAQRIPS